MDAKRTDLVKWLKILLYFQIAELVVALIGYLPINTSWCQWLQRLLNAGNIVCFFMLASAGGRYLTAAILGSVWLALTLVEGGIQFYSQIMMVQGIFNVDDLMKFNEITAVLNLIAMVTAWIYTYQLYHAHGDLIKELDASLSRKWGTLFKWSLTFGILTTVASMIFARVYTNMSMDSQTMIQIFYTLIDIPGKIIMLISVVYLYRMIQKIKNQEI